MTSGDERQTPVNHNANTSDFDVDGAAAISDNGVDALLSPDIIGGGVLCNDASGMCVWREGKIDTSQAGTYTTIMELAGRLSGANANANMNMNASHDTTPTDTAESENGNSATTATSSLETPLLQLPLVTMETDRATLLIKEYNHDNGPHTLVWRVPRAAVHV
jgi:hypothetical protein